MNDEKWTIKLNGTKSPLNGNIKKGIEIDDLDKIAKELGTNKSDLLNDNIIKDIHVKQIKIWHGEYIDSIQFIYKVITNDKTYSINGDKHGGNGGKETIIKFEDDEHILAISGQYGDTSHGNLDRLKFINYIPSKKHVKLCTISGKYDTILFDMSPATGTVYTCFFGKCTHDSITNIGMYEGSIQNQSQQFQQSQQLQQLSDLLFPSKPYDFPVLKQEIVRLKYQELAPQVRNEKIKFEELTTNLKTKTGGLENVVDLLLDAQKEAIKNNDQSIQGELNAYKKILESKNLTKDELQILLSKQTELNQLEERLANLQINEGLANCK
ncbi:jacalin-like lectin domain protein [Gigaspora margarita]|uniref:Jacalin-like lectin domain protein n=1 Tax=Gigaspora margarita TaxID=4874 RepID=A0A8H3X5U8_GIGMA|nr:jacalin-like lectin domain protein [Gigaspora margarita]